MQSMADSEFISDQKKKKSNRKNKTRPLMILKLYYKIIVTLKRFVLIANIF